MNGHHGANAAEVERLPGGAEVPGTGPAASAHTLFGRLLRLRTFFYMLLATGLLLFQINSTIAIKELALENEKLRQSVRLSMSVITSQELKVNELLSIRNITGDAETLGLYPSLVPAIELAP